MTARKTGSSGRRDEILVEARNLFVNRGYRRTTVEEIAEACALGKTALYYYFESKEEIFEQVVRAESERFVRRIREAVDAADGPIERVRAFVSTRFALIEEFLMIHRVSQQAARELVPMAETARQEFFQQEIGLLAEILSDGHAKGVFHVKRPTVLATSMISACSGLERQFLEIQEAPPLSAGIDELLDVLLFGLCRSA